jgi:hydroxypyruvate reductase
MSINQSINEDAQAIWQAGVAAVDPKLRMKQFVSIDDKGIAIGKETICHSEYRNIVVVGAGKSSGAMAAALDEIFNSLPASKQVVGQVNVPDNRELTLRRINVVGCRPVGANLPTERVLSATDSIIELLRQSDPADLVIGLFCGGGSALLERTIDSVSLDELQQVTSYLSRQGASIEELNCVRSQLSLVKRGGLARLIPCRQVISLLISDVLGDPLETIASGPTWMPDSESNSESQRQLAKAVIARYARQAASIPESIHRCLDSNGRQAHSLHRYRPEVKHLVIANNQVAVEAAYSKGLALGYQGNCETDFSADRAEVVAKQFTERLSMGLKKARQSSRKSCLISGGEPTVLVKNFRGRGGRNQHLVLAAIESILANPADFETGQFSFLSAGTDGEDGNVAVAGAQFDSVLLRRLGLPEAIEQAQQHLRETNSHTLLKKWDCLFQADEINTNVCDLRVLLWETRGAK